VGRSGVQVVDVARGEVSPSGDVGRAGLGVQDAAVATLDVSSVAVCIVSD
jgi:hypothetical protein